MTRLGKFFIGLVIAAITLGNVPTFVFAQATGCDDLPGIELKQSLNSAGTYAVWLLAKKETPTAKPYIKIDTNACQELALPKGTGWEWVKGSGGSIKQSLSAGEHSFKVSVDGGAVLIDKILVSTDTNCDPSDNGQNCIEEPVDFVVEGIEQGSTVTGERRISASLSVETNDKVSMEFFIDDRSVAKQLVAPYCLTETSTSTCGLYNLSTLSEGKHTIRVSATTPGGQYVTKSIDFTVGKQNSLPPSVGSVSNSGETNLPDNIQLSLSGITEGETVSGKKIISAVVSGVSTPATVSFALNGTDISSGNSVPYCFVPSSNCGEWDSETVTNGDYVLYAFASSVGVKSKEVRVNFKVRNSALAVVVSDEKKQIVVGNTNQQVSGKANVTLPATKLKDLRNIKSIIYKIDGKKVGEATPARPNIELDTTKLTSKKHRVSAVLGSYNGETEELTSEVVVRNDVVSSATTWLKQNALATIAISLAVTLTLYVVIRFVVGKLRYRRMMKLHNIAETYMVVPGSKHGAKWHVSYALSSAVVVFGVGLVLFRLGVSQAGVGVGFVNEMESGTPFSGFSGLSLGYEDNMKIAFARLSYTKPITTATNAPTDPSPAANGDGFAVNTASTGFEAETMSLASGLGMATVDSSAHASMSMLIWSNGSAYKTINSAAFQAVTVRARGDQCNGAPIMVVKIDGTAVMTTQVSQTVWTDFSVPTTQPAGAHNFEVSFTNDSNTSCDRNLYVDTVGLSTTALANTAVAPSGTIQPTTTPTAPSTPTPTTPAPTTTTHTGMAQHNGMGPMIDNSKIPGPFPSMTSPVLWYNTGYVPFADDIGAFRTDCTVSHITYDDPIVYPGRPGAAHLHTFFGNSGVDAYSTQQSIETTGGSTCSGGTLNRTGYWMPTVLDANGVPVMPERVLVYYKTSYYGVSAQSVVAPPAGLRMIAGSSASTTVQAKDPYGKSISSYACNSETFPYPVVTGGTSIDTYCPEGARQLFMEIRFPQCWDGVNLDSFDHKSHMAYPTGYGCPASHPVGIPEIQLRVKYNYFADRSGWRLSSDNYSGGPGGYSSHADWFNGWDRTTLQKIVTNCWNAQRDCQVDNIGNGEKLGRY